MKYRGGLVTAMAMIMVMEIVSVKLCNYKGTFARGPATGLRCNLICMAKCTRDPHCSPTLLSYSYYQCASRTFLVKVCRKHHIARPTKGYTRHLSDKCADSCSICSQRKEAVRSLWSTLKKTCTHRAATKLLTRGNL